MRNRKSEPLQNVGSLMRSSKLSKTPYSSIYQRLTKLTNVRVNEDASRPQDSQIAFNVRIDRDDLILMNKVLHKRAVCTV